MILKALAILALVALFVCKLVIGKGDDDTPGGVMRWLADFTAWRRWRRVSPMSWIVFRAITQQARREGKQVYIRGWRARWGN